MKKQKIVSALVFFLGLSSFIFVANSAQAAPHGGATVSWGASTDDVAVAGYRVYYSTSAISCTNWEAATQTARKADGNPGTLLAAPYRDVPSPSSSVLKYTFGNTTYLTPGSTYNFVVVAYDTASPSGNLSNCALTSGSAKFTSKAITYSADFDLNNHVNVLDYNLLKFNFGSTSGTPINGDADGSGTVNIFDYNILKADFGY